MYVCKCESMSTFNYNCGTAFVITVKEFGYMSNVHCMTPICGLGKKLKLKFL